MLVLSRFSFLTLAAIAPPALAQVPAMSREPARSDTVALSLAAARRLALRQNPLYLAARENEAAAAGALRQARTFRFNPELALVAPGAGTSASPLELTLTQEIEWAGQRGLRAGAARAALAASGAGTRDAARLTLAATNAAYFRALAARYRLGLAEEQYSLTARLLQAVRIQTREGEISALESNLAEMEAARARARVLAALRDVTVTIVELQRLTGIPPGTPLRLLDDTLGAPDAHSLAGPMVLDSLTALAFARRPDLAAARERLRQAKTLVSLARREVVPNLRVGAITERDRGGSTSRLGAVAGITLPFLNRNRGTIRQREAEVRRTAQEMRAVELRLRAELDEALQSYRSSDEEVAVFTTSVLRPARENSARLETAYRAGKITLPTLLLLRNQLLDAELGYWNAWLARREALVRLEAATGAGPLLDTIPDSTTPRASAQ